MKTSISSIFRMDCRILGTEIQRMAGVRNWNTLFILGAMRCGVNLYRFTGLKIISTTGKKWVNGSE
jgi:hypothetical protein